MAAWAGGDGTTEVVWAIGDLHGDAHCARRWVERTGLIRHLGLPSASWEWALPSARLVFIGDYIDKGPQSKNVLELVSTLEERFPEEVTALMGNHELNLLLDRSVPAGSPRYLEHAFGAAHPAQYALWLEEAERTGNTTRALDVIHRTLSRVYAQGLHASVRMAATGAGSIVEFVTDAEERPLVASELERWQAAYLRGVASGSRLGGWLMRRPLSAIMGDTVFVHGGIPPGTTRSALLELNRELRQQTSAEEFAGFVYSHPLAQELVEDRRLHRSCARVRRVTSELNVSRVAVGHTPGDSVRISCGGGLLAIDSALGRWFRASGNFYCPGVSSDGASGKDREAVCPAMNPRCEGQILRLSRGADGEWDVERIEAAAEDLGEELTQQTPARSEAGLEATHAELRL